MRAHERRHLDPQFLPSNAPAGLGSGIPDDRDHRVQASHGQRSTRGAAGSDGFNQHRRQHPRQVLSAPNTRRIDHRKHGPASVRRHHDPVRGLRVPIAHSGQVDAARDAARFPRQRVLLLDRKPAPRKRLKQRGPGETLQHEEPLRRRSRDQTGGKRERSRRWHPRFTEQHRPPPLPIVPRKPQPGSEPSDHAVPHRRFHHHGPPVDGRTDDQLVTVTLEHLAPRDLQRGELAQPSRPVQARGEAVNGEGRRDRHAPQRTRKPAIAWATLP